MVEAADPRSMTAEGRTSKKTVRLQKIENGRGDLQKEGVLSGAGRFLFLVDKPP
jgi:hypothetical protein